MIAKDGDIVEFTAIAWDDGWDFDHPTVLLSPVLKVDESGKSCESFIEDVAMDLTWDNISDDPFNDMCGWRGWKISNLRRVVRDRLNGKDTWKTKLREIVKQKIRFFKDDEGELSFEVLETIILNKLNRRNINKGL